MFIPALSVASLPLLATEQPVAFPLPIMKFKKKCCKSFRNGKRCKRCPGNMKAYMRKRAAAMS